MPDAEPDAPPPAPIAPPWLEPATLRAMEAAVRRTLAWNRTAWAVAEAAREVARAHLPAATMGMIAEAVAAVLPDPQGPAAPHGPEWRGEPLAEASPEEVAASLAYAMRFDERGKARRTGHEYAAELAARQLVSQLAASRFVVMRRAPDKPHTAGGG